MRRWRRESAATVALVVAAMLASGGCSATKPPRRTDDACSIFREKDDWYGEARDARERWGVPISIQLAFIHQESSFDGDARPPRRRILGFLPGPRPSNAHGYAQALKSTWDEYREATGRGGADRDEFGDAVDFIGWYNTRSAKLCGIAKNDAYRLYLAYHEGPGGYRKGTWKKKQWLLATAKKVAHRAERYRSQLASCEKDLARKKRFWLF